MHALSLIILEDSGIKQMNKKKAKGCKIAGRN